MSQKQAAIASKAESVSAAKAHVSSAGGPVKALSVAGNRGLAQLLGAKIIRAKLEVGSPDDPMEHEADRVAENIDRRGTSGVQPVSPRTRGDQDTLSLQRKAADSGTPATASVEAGLRGGTRGGGSPLPGGIRVHMEQHIGEDFSAVRVHTDATAAGMNRDIHARAFTHGTDIYFAEGKYNPHSGEGRRLLAHELTHVAQQRRGLWRRLIQRQGGKHDQDDRYHFTIQVPIDAKDLEEVNRLCEILVYGRVINARWQWVPGTTIESIRGKVVGFNVPKSDFDARQGPEAKKEEEQSKKEYGQLSKTQKSQVDAEAEKRYRALSGDKSGKGNAETKEGSAKARESQTEEVLREKKVLESLPPEVLDLMGTAASFTPSDYQQLIRISEKLKQFTHEDLTAFKLLSTGGTRDLNLFEKAIDMFLARRTELKKALDEELQKQQASQGQGGKEKSLDETFNEKLKDVDAASYGKLSESDRYKLAREKTSELTEAQLKYMASHPGETLKDFAKSATLVNTPETFSAIGKDIKEAASGDANSWARWAAGTGAGAKLSGWLLAVAGVLYVASWLTGIGELATIAAAAAILLGSTLVLSGVESELRIKAASQAKTPEEFDRNVKLAAAARSNVIVGVALIIVAALLHFAAKAAFPETINKFKTSLKNFREKIRVKGSIYELKPKISAELGGLKSELFKSAEAAKQKAIDAAAELEKLTPEQFAERLDKGDGGFIDPSKIPPEQRINYSELVKTPEGRTAVEDYKTRLVNALKTDVPAELDRLAQEYGSKIDEFLKEVDAAKNHDDLKAAADKLESALAEEKAKQFIAGEQERITKQKLEEEAQQAHKEALAAAKAAIVNRVKARIAGNPKFQLTYNDAELDAIISKGKELGLSDSVIEDLLYVGSRIDKAISAADLMQQMANWANEISKRGFPYKFVDEAQYRQFSKDLLTELRKTGLPTNDVRIQGSALRKTAANDVDIAVFVEESRFDQLLVDRFKDAITFKDAKVQIAGKTHEQLSQLVADIKADAAKPKGTPKDYNASARTFMNAFDTGIINSKSDIIKPLKPATDAMQAKYPQLNIETISVLIREGKFDLKPDLPVKDTPQGNQ